MSARLSRNCILALLLAGGLAPAVAAPAPSRSESETYTAAPLGGVDCAANTGGACFELTGEERSIGLRVNDADGWVGIPLRYAFRDLAGRMLGEGSLCDQGWVSVPRGAAALAVEVTAVGVMTPCNSASVTAGGAIVVTYALRPGEGNQPELDGERGCIGGFVQEPLSMSLQGRDTGQRITLDTLILLDQGLPGAVDPAQAQASMERVIAAYHAIGLDVAHRFRAVTLLTAPGAGGLYDVDQLFGEARAQVGGSVPAGFDLVHIMTTKDIRSAAGFADCVGGIRSRRNAFSIAEEVPGKPPNIIAGVPAPAWPWLGPGYISTHEIGHLLGGNHDYANCVEGLTDASGGGDAPGVCTIMHPNLNISFAFSTLNRTEIREYAIRFAAP